MNLLFSTTIFSFYTMVSRVLGYLRDILIAIFLGTSIYADAFFVAFRLPNTFRRLFAEGTFNAAFIPSYTAEKIRGKLQSKRFEDDFIRHNYDIKDIFNLNSKFGEVFLARTDGFHKGGFVEKGFRTIIIVEYSC